MGGSQQRRAGRAWRVGSVLAALALAACGWLLPERFAVNAPLLHLVFGVGTDAPSDEVLGRIEVPEGFRIGVFADELPNARLLRFTAAGDLLVSSPRGGSVLLLWADADGDGRSDGRQTLLEGLDRPHGLDLHDGWLYVAETGGVGRIRFDGAGRRTVGGYQRLLDGLPSGGNHFTRTLRFGPDGWMYVSIGSSCNVCEESHPLRATIVRARPDGSQLEVFATGLRNAVGFDWRPESGALYATENGRDLLGDDFPPCELNRVERGGFYGWPYANGDRRPDPDLGPGHADEVQRSIPPAHAFGAHTAPLGIHFLEDVRQPEAYRGAALVALHGSWNRTRKAGYRVVSLHWRPDGEVVERDFAVGFERDEQVFGRPVDVAEGPDAAIYVSDDYAGAVYRIARASSATATAPSAPVRRSAGDPLSGLSAEERAAAGERGLTLYRQYACASCHEPERAPPGVLAVPLARLGSRYDLTALSRYLAVPNPPMPSYELSEAQRRDLAVLLLERHP
jgi:glucose/arabinose dehydrogenase